ncbi:MAG: hypothetical protein ACI4WX_13895 [Aristaeellaceae bacterium]
MKLTRITTMHAIFGQDTCHTCGDCCNLIHLTPTSRPVTKCALYGVTASAATDWRAYYMACGRHNKPITPDESTVLEQQNGRRPSADDGPLSGQMTMMEMECFR